MRWRCTKRGYIGLTVGVAAAVLYLLTGTLGKPAPAQGQSGSGSSAPTERIDVEQAVDFPYDI